MVVKAIGPIILPKLTKTSAPPVATEIAFGGDSRADSAMNAPFQPLAVDPSTKNSAQAAASGQAGPSASASRQAVIITPASTASARKQSRIASAIHPQNTRPKTPPA